MNSQVCFVLLIALCNVYGKCSFNMSSQQACDSIANLSKGDIFVTYEQLFAMVKDMYNRTKPKSTSENFNVLMQSSEHITDDDLWNIMRYRQERRKEHYENLNIAWNNLRERHEKVSGRNRKQLASLQQMQLKYENCRSLKARLLQNTTELSTRLAQLQELYKLAIVDLEQTGLDYNHVKEQYDTCEQKFFETRTVVSEMLGPSPNVDYIKDRSVSSNVDENLIDLNQEVRNFIKRLTEKQKIVDEMEAQLKQLQTSNAALQLEVARQQQEANVKSATCTKELLALKKMNQQIPKSVLLEKDKPQDICLNKIDGDFCTFESTDLVHNETCWFERKLPADYNWRVVSDIRETRRVSAVMDHTCSSLQGRFLYVDLSQLIIGQEAKLTSVPLYSSAKQCFSFWYNIGYAFNYGKFYAVALIKSQHVFGNSQQVWRQNLVKQKQWQFASFEVPTHVGKQGYRIQLVAESNGPGYVAVDDLALTAGPCPR